MLDAQIEYQQRHLTVNEACETFLGLGQTKAKLTEITITRAMLEAPECTEKYNRSIQICRNLIFFFFTVHKSSTTGAAMCMMNFSLKHPGHLV